MVDSDDFSCYRVSILNDIKRMFDNFDRLQAVVMTLALDVEGLKATAKVRSAVWGSLSGGIVALAAVFAKILLER